MASRLWDTLMRFHREVVKPDMHDTLIRFHREVVKPDMHETLMRFHREVVKPDVENIVNGALARYHRETMLPTLMRFHREVVKPDIEEAVDGLGEEMLIGQRQTQANFDAVYDRFDRLESEHHALTAAVGRLEKQSQREN